MSDNSDLDPLSEVSDAVNTAKSQRRPLRSASDASKALLSQDWRSPPKVEFTIPSYRTSFPRSLPDLVNPSTECVRRPRTRSTPTGRSAETVASVDPEIDVSRMCRGAILYAHQREVCGDPVGSRSTGRMGNRAAGSRAMRDFGWGHPSVVLDHGLNEDGEFWALVANITSFNKTSTAECLEHTRAYHQGVLITPKGEKTIKYANALLFAREHEGTVEGDLPFLQTTGGKMALGCAIACEAIYSVRTKHLRAYGVRNPNAWDMRLDETSYKMVLREMGLPERTYESLEEMLASGPPRRKARHTEVSKLRKDMFGVESAMAQLTVQRALEE